MLTTRTLIAALAVCASGFAHAGSAQYSASMSLPNGIPDLVTGSPAWDGPETLAGQWTTAGRPHAYVNARDITGHDAVTGAPTFGEWRGGSGGHHKGGPLGTMMEAYDNLPSLDYKSSSSANVFWDRMSASGTVADASAEIDTNATWNRNFSIDPLTTFTFSALSTLSILGDAAPLVSQSFFNFDANASFASMTMADATGRVRNTIGAAISSVLPSDLGGVFGFSFGPGGLLSLSITNTTTAAMTGTLSAGSYVNISAPVPEPETIAMMLAGLALVGGVARRRQHARTRTPAA